MQIFMSMSLPKGTSAVSFKSLGMYGVKAANLVRRLLRDH